MGTDGDCRRDGAGGAIASRLKRSLVGIGGGVSVAKHDATSTEPREEHRLVRTLLAVCIPLLYLAFGDTKTELIYIYIYTHICSTIADRCTNRDKQIYTRTFTTTVKTRRTTEHKVLCPKPALLLWTSLRRRQCYCTCYVHYTWRTATSALAEPSTFASIHDSKPAS